MWHPGAAQRARTGSRAFADDHAAGLDIKEFVDGRVAREWQYANGAEVLRALLGLTVEVPLDERTP